MLCALCGTATGRVLSVVRGSQRGALPHRALTCRGSAGFDSALGADVELAPARSQVWNTLTGEELLTLEGHKNVVYAIAFNNPFGDKVNTPKGWRGRGKGSGCVQRHG